MPEPDSSAAVFRSHAKELAALLASGEERARLWRPEELAAIFRHQISTPMAVDLGGFDPRTAAQLKLVWTLRPVGRQPQNHENLPK